MLLPTTQLHKSRRRFPAVRMSRLPCATVPLEPIPPFLMPPATIYATLPVTAANDLDEARRPMPIAISDT
jgi:hypothetical protein